MIKLLFACGHEVVVDESKSVLPTCSCGEYRIERVTARPPTFKGHVSGPLAKTQYLGPIPVDLTTEGPLKLRKRES